MKQSLEKHQLQEQKLSLVGLKYTRTKLGQAVFVHEKVKGSFTDPMLFPSDWTIEQLRGIADYMEANPRCCLFSDGSGRLCK